MLQAAIRQSLNPDENMTYEEMEAIAERVGTVHRGFKPGEIDMMQWKAYPDHQHAAEKEEEDCSICQSQFRATEKVMELKCKHTYHK